MLLRQCCKPFSFKGSRSRIPNIANLSPILHLYSIFRLSFICNQVEMFLLYSSVMALSTKDVKETRIAQVFLFPFLKIEHFQQICFFSTSFFNCSNALSCFTTNSLYIELVGILLLFLFDSSPRIYFKNNLLKKFFLLD